MPTLLTLAKLPMKTKRIPEDWIGVGAMAILCLITMANVLIRYFSDQSFAMTEEVSIFLMLLLTLAGASAAMRKDAHMRIEFFYETGSTARQRLLQLFSALVSAVFFFGLGLLFCRILFDEIKFAETSMGLGLPRWIYTMWVPLFCFVICARAVGLARRVSAKPVTEAQAE